MDRGILNIVLEQGGLSSVVLWVLGTGDCATVQFYPNLGFSGHLLETRSH